MRCDECGKYCAECSVTITKDHIECFDCRIRKEYIAREQSKLDKVLAALSKSNTVHELNMIDEHILILANDLVNDDGVVILP